jgi:transmembrane sensor
VDDLAQKLATLRETFKPEWSETRRDLALRGVECLQQRQRRLRIAAGASSAGLAAFGLIYALAGWQTSGGSPSLAARPASGAQVPEAAPSVIIASRTPSNQALPTGTPVQLADGSRTTLATADSQLFLERNEPEHVALRLASGAAHFEVVPNTQREFGVVSGAIKVIVVGTAFDVEQTATGVRVSVSHGKVRVQGPAGEAFVEAGESRWFDRAPEAASAAAAAGKPKSAALKRKAAAPTKEPAAAPLGWRSLSQSGDHERAYALLEQGAVVDDDVETLMEAADAARLTGHSEAAVRYLRKVVSDHRSNPATPLAAFTLGRMLLGQLGRPSEAAEAFALARELAPDGSLCQDALAREVEAWSKAGRSTEAYVRARLFLERYPESRRRRVVEFYGGLGAH